MRVHKIAYGVVCGLACQQAFGGDPNGVCTKIATSTGTPLTRTHPNGTSDVTGVPHMGRAPDFSGYGSASYQIRITGLAPGDGVQAFTNSQFGVTFSETGRINPFAVPSMTTESPSGELTVFTESGGTVQRIAGAHATTMFTNLDFGIRTGQAPRYISGPAFNDSLNPTFIHFKFNVGSTPGPRDIVFTIPYESFLGGHISYYKNFEGTEIGYIPIDPEAQTPVVLHVVECPSDFNADDAVDFFDYLDYVDAFSSGLPEADWDNDGAVDFFDYLSYLGQFVSGC